MCMLGWGYRFCEKKMLIKSDMTEKAAEKFPKKFGKIYKSGRTKDAEKFMEVFPEIYESKMKVYNLINL